MKRPFTRTRWPGLKRGPKRSAGLSGYDAHGSPIFEILTYQPGLKRGQTTVGKKRFKYITRIEVRE